jgi:hypothetical protein
MSDTIDRPAPVGFVPYVQWGAVFAGAVSAAALATVLHAFAGAIGLAVSSTAPTWRDASIGLWILSGVYLILVGLAAYGLGGYIAGLLRERFGTTARADEIEFRDNVHGLLVWAIATPSGGNAGPATSVGGENIIAFDIDRLLRSDRRTADTGDVSRAEVARILLTSSSHSGVVAEDRTYLVRLVSLRTGLGAPEAERRVDSAIASAKNNIARARRSTTILAFMAGAAALLGAVAAWFAAAVGGQHRDDTTGTGHWNFLGRRSGIATKQF